MGQSYNEHLNLAGIEQHSGQVYTYTGGAFGAIELTGVDPTGVTPSQGSRISLLLRNIVQLLPLSVTLTQYYIHNDGVKIRLTGRDNQRSQLLSMRRQAYLNKCRNLNASRIIWTLDVHPEENINRLASAEFLKNLFNSMFDDTARRKVRLALSNRESFIIERQAFEKQCLLLKETLRDLDLRLSFISEDNRILDSEGIWRLQKFLATFNHHWLAPRRKVTVPNDMWDCLALEGDDIEAITWSGVDMLKIQGVRPVYVRLASVLKIGDESVPECAWALTNGRPVLQRGNYVYFMRFTPASAFKKSLMISGKENELVRTQISLSDLMTDSTSKDILDEKLRRNSHLMKMREELENISYSDERLGICQAGIAVFNTDPDKLLETCADINRSVSQTMQVVWETVAQLDAYKVMQPAYSRNTFRALQLNASQMGAASLFFKSHPGIPEWELNGRMEEAFYILESDDGVPFFFTPKVKEKLLLLGNGATRGGKTFMKNCIASHFIKFGGLYNCLDIDPGSIPMANFFGDDGAAFTLDSDFQCGFNMFSMAQSKDDRVFLAHLIEQLKAMAAENDSEQDKYLTPDELENITVCASDLLVQKFSPNEGRLSSITLSTLVSKCGQSVKRKLAPFISNGIYGRLFDNKEDAIGVLDKPVAVYNLSGVKDNHNLARLVHREIFFRVVRLFESPEYRTIPKFFEIDEAQYTLSVPHAAEFATQKARTWFKHGGGMGFWTQNPEHYSSLDEWTTLRSSASVFIFMPDNEATVKAFHDAYGFDEEEVNIIRSLKVKQQSYIKIPDMQIAKVVNLFVEAEQYAVCTSTSNEAALAAEIWKRESDPDVAVRQIVEGLITKCNKDLIPTPTETEKDKTEGFFL